MTGTCKEFDADKGYGTITGDDGNSFFCHFSSIQSDDISLDAGERVSFTPAESVRGKMATLVTRIQKGGVQNGNMQAQW